MLTVAPKVNYGCLKQRRDRVEVLAVHTTDAQPYKTSTEMPQRVA